MRLDVLPGTLVNCAFCRDGDRLDQLCTIGKTICNRTKKKKTIIKHVVHSVHTGYGFVSKPGQM